MELNYVYPMAQLRREIRTYGKLADNKKRFVDRMTPHSIPKINNNKTV